MQYIRERNNEPIILHVAEWNKEALKLYKKVGITDEFINPSIIKSDGCIEDNDSIITFNFRPDRLRELYASLTNKDFVCFERKILKNIKLVNAWNTGDIYLIINERKKKIINKFWWINRKL